MTANPKEGSAAQNTSSVFLKEQKGSYDTSHVAPCTQNKARETGKLTKFDSASEFTKEGNVAIVLGYFEGKPFIEEQLNSIFNQSHSFHHVFLCDDQSRQPFAINEHRLKNGGLAKLSICKRSENLGFSNNFLTGLSETTDEFDYFAFSDQDDVWHRDKLDKAIKALGTVSVNTPALYCARTEISDAKCKQTLGFSPLFTKPPSFANALVQSISGGNTMVFNRAAKNLIVEASLNTPVVSHDWWCYQIITGAGGYVIYDPEPCLKYRQHGKNQIGANNNQRARLVRLRSLLQGQFRTWNSINLKALVDHKHLLTNDNQKTLNDFIAARHAPLAQRLVFSKRAGIYRQTLLDNLGLLFGIILNKV